MSSEPLLPVTKSPVLPLSSPVIGYPISADPPNPKKNPKKKEKKVEEDYTCGDYLVLSVPVVLLIIVVATVIIQMVTMVSEGYFDEKPNFQITSISVSDFSINASSHTIKGNWHVTLQVHNKNNTTLFFDDMKSLISYKSKILDKRRIPPLEINNEKNYTSLVAKFSTLNSTIDHGYIADMMNEDLAQGNVPFNIKLRGKVNIFGFLWKYKVSCNNVPVGIMASTGSGNLIGGSKHCITHYSEYLP